MKQRAYTSHTTRRALTIHDPEVTKYLPQLKQDTESGQASSPKGVFKKLHNMFYSPQSAQSVRASNPGIMPKGMSQTTNSGFLQTSFTSEKPKSPQSQFYVSPRNRVSLKKATEPDEQSEYIRYSTKKPSIQSETAPFALNSKHKIHVSHFMFDPEKTRDLDLDAVKKYYTSSSPSHRTGETYSRPGTTAYTESGATASLRATTAGFNPSFQTRLNLVTEEDHDAKLREIESLGTYKRQTISQPGFYQAKGSLNTTLTSSAVKRKEKFWFRLKNNAATNNKLNVHAYRKNQDANKRALTNEEIIAENKDKLMERNNMDLNSPKSATKAEIEFNMKVNEVQRKLKLGSQYRFLYLLNGTSVFELSKIPRRENVVILSPERELYSIEDILQNELVSDFYEYGMKKDMPIYSKSQVESRMSSLLDAKRQVDQKYLEVLKVFDEKGDTQLDSEQLALLVNSPKDAKLKDIATNIIQNFDKKETSVISERTEKQSTETYQRGEGTNRVDFSIASSDNSYRDRIVEMETNQKISRANTKTEEYLRGSKMLMQSQKLNTYKEIMGYYSNLNKIKIDPEEPDQQFINAAEANEDDEELHNIRCIDNVSKNLSGLLKRLKNPRKKLDYLEIKKELQRLKTVDMSNQTVPVEEILFAQSEEKVLNPEEETEKIKNYIRENIKVLDTKKGDIQKVYKGNKELFLQNIPKYILNKRMTRRELHIVYILYKALCEVTSQRHKHYKFEDGIDYHSFRNGIYQVFLQSEEVAEKIFYKIDHNFSGFLNWDEFLDAMMIIRARTLRDKIDLFIKIADEDQNGNLSKEEIFNLTRICLGKFIQNKEDGFLDDLCDYFTRLIFESVGVSLDEEIPLQAIKDAIISQSEGSDLLAMFCGADI